MRLRPRWGGCLLDPSLPISDFADEVAHARAEQHAEFLGPIGAADQMEGLFFEVEERLLVAVQEINALGADGRWLGPPAWRQRG